MTVASTTSRTTYTSNGSATVYPYTFRVLTAAQLRVITRSAVSGAETVLSYPSQYSVSGVGNPTGGSITLVSPVTVGDTIVIRRSPTIKQETSFRSQGSFFPESHEDALDLRAMVEQYLDDALSRSLKIAETLDPAAYTLVLPSPTAGMVLTGTGTGFTMSSVASSSAVTLPGSGRTVATLSAYLANNAVFNIKDFGALGNGVADDAPAIAAAVGAAGNNAVVLAPPGTYGWGAAGMTVTSAARLRLIGYGATIKLLAAPTTTPANFQKTAFYFNGCTDCSAEGFKFDGNGFGGSILSLNACAGMVIDRNLFDAIGVAGAGVVTTRGCTGTQLTRNNVTNVSTSAPAFWLGNYGASLMDTDVLAHGNYFHAIGGDAIVCSSVGGSITGNVVDGSGFSGIVFGGANGFASCHLSIIGNRIGSYVTHGIQADVIYTSAADLPFDITIQGNTIYGGGAASSGIYLSNVNRVVAGGNACFNAGYGITLARATHVLLKGNFCSETRVGGARTQQVGIDLVANGVGSSDISMIGNECKNNVLAGIRVGNVAAEAITNVVLQGNRCTANSQQGIFVYESTAATVTGVVVNGNLCRSNGVTDLRVEPLDALINDNLYTTELSTQYFSFTDADTTPSVLGARKTFRAANTGATSITTFDDGVNGQEFEVYCSTGNTTFVNSGTFILQAGVNYTAPINSFIRFRKLATIWFETYRSTDIVRAAALADLGALSTTQTAGAAYTATEQSMLASIKTDLTSIRNEINTLLANRRTAKEQA